MRTLSKWVRGRPRRAPVLRYPAVARIELPLPRVIVRQTTTSSSGGPDEHSVGLIVEGNGVQIDFGVDLDSLLRDLQVADEWLTQVQQRSAE